MPSVSASSPGHRVTCPVGGMTCAACQSAVERSLTRTAGVHEARVNLMLHSATVTYDPAVVPVAGLIEAVRDIGYEAELRPAHGAFGAAAADAATAPHDDRGVWTKAVVSLTAGAARDGARRAAHGSGSRGAHPRVTPDPFMRGSWRAWRRPSRPGCRGSMPCRLA